MTHSGDSSRAALEPGPARAVSERIRRDWVLYLIAFDKLVKGVGVAFLGIESLYLSYHDVHETVLRWANNLHIAPGNHYLREILMRSLNIAPSTLRLLGYGLFIYAALYFVEGTGLALRKHWAEWVVVISTGVFVPLEVFEIARHPSWLKAFVLTTNILMVVYLAVRLRREHRMRHPPKSKA